MGFSSIPVVKRFGSAPGSLTALWLPVERIESNGFNRVETLTRKNGASVCQEEINLNLRVSTLLSSTDTLNRSSLEGGPRPPF